jgi:Gas vesicle synthesis protein GvpL/GvpF
VISWTYIYGLVRSGETAPVVAQPIMDQSAELRFVSVGPVAALVSQVPTDDVTANRRNMMTHTRVLEVAMQDRTIVPMRFGMVAASEGHVLRGLEPQTARLIGMLDDLDDRIEAGIRMTWDQPTLISEVVRETPKLARFADQIRRKSEAEAYYDRIELGRMTDEALKAKRDREALAILDRLARHAVRKVSHPPGEDMVVLNAALLLDRAMERAFMNEIEAVERENGERLRIKVVAPAPAYNFANLKLNVGIAEPLKGAA